MKSNRRILFPVLVLAAGALGAAGMWAATRNAGQPPSGPPILSLDRMGHLVSVKVNYSNVIEFLQPRTVGVPWTHWYVSLGGTKVLLVAKGDCTVGSDVRDARYENVNAKEHSLTVVLPAPAPQEPRINHATRDQGGSYFYAITQQGLQPVLPGHQNSTLAVDGALRRAQTEVEQACRQPAVLAMARENSETVLGRVFLTMGWKARFVWK